MNQQNPLLQLQQYGQSIWLDYIERRFLNDGSLQQLIREDGVTGVTSNPAIFNKAISHAFDYQNAIARLSAGEMSTLNIYECLTIEDVVQAADQLYATYLQRNGADGYVSIEVSPLLAHNTNATVNAAMRLWDQIQRPNVMIKVPGTLAGLPAIRRLIFEGINVNVTLLFSPRRYLEVAEAYLDGLEARLNSGKTIHNVASVASFFLSRIDTKVDAMLDSIAMRSATTKAQVAHELRGQTALASAGIAYQRFMDIYASSAWQHLAEHGARKQRLLWASTGAKDPLADPLKYIEYVIGAETINTVPLETLELYRRNGKPARHLPSNQQTDSDIMRRLNGIGIRMDKIEAELEIEGIQKFIEPYQQSLAAIKSLRTHTRSAILQ